MNTTHATMSWPFTLWHLALSALLTASITAVAWAPREQTMGDAQRVLYIHVAVAWLGLLAFIVMALAGVMYLVKREITWDHYSQSAGELGWLCCTLTLITGSLWAHAAWGTWWTWDPRLLTSFIMWALFCGYLLVRESIVDVQQRARLAAVVAILGLLDVPLVIMATRWFRGIHPVSPQMDPKMRAVMILTIVAFTAFVATLFYNRTTQIRLQHEVDALECD